VTARLTSALPAEWRRSDRICSDARCSVTRLCARYVTMSASVSVRSARSLLCASPMPMPSSRMV
jgi:hypothetical protein